MRSISRNFIYVPTWISALAMTAILSVALSGCATSKDDVLPQTGPTMQQIYDEHFGRLQTGRIEDTRRRLHVRSPPATRANAAQSIAPRRPIATSTRDLAGYTRDAQREIEAIFPTVPNPTLVMYVFPHLAKPEGVPVPGYATSFTLYARDHYALPGEAPPLGY